MNKVCVIAVNSKYTHSSLALRYFRENCGCDIFECSINDNVLDIFSKISGIDADIFAFSTYIWNVEFVLKLASVIKKADESKKIILGGPEAGYNAENILREHLFVDGVIKGEGEYALKALCDGREEIPNFCFRDGDKIVCSDCIKVNLDELKFPYTSKDLEVLENRLVYFETSRGCLYNCSYCLSSSEGKTRYFSQDYVFEGLDFFINNVITKIQKIMQLIKPQTIKNDSHIVRSRSTSTISISFSLVVSVVVMVVSVTGILVVSGCVLNLATSLFNLSISNCNRAFLLCSIASASISTLPALSQRSNASMLAESGGVVTVTMCVLTTVSVR